MKIEFLKRIAADRELEIEWIDLLSQLEYVGCRKIVKGVGFESVSLDVLRHVSEEASHAFLLKELVGRGRSWVQGRFSAAGWKYFQRLDQRISALPVDAKFRYPGVSWAIERRVLEVYPEYLRITHNEALKDVLRRILAQEKRHGAQFELVDFPDEFRDRAAKIEQELWDEFTADVQSVLAGSSGRSDNRSRRNA